MKKSLLTLSILSVSLLASCAKSDAQVAFIKTKKCVNESYIIKSWDSCEFARLDSKKFIETLSDEDAIAKVKEKGNIVALHFTFTTMNNQQFEAYSVVNKKEVDWGTKENANEAVNYLNASLTYQAYVTLGDEYVATGALIKVKKA